MKTLTIPGALRSPWQTAGLGAATEMGSLLLAAPVTAGAVHLAGHQHAMVLLTDGTPIPGPHVRPASSRPSRVAWPDGSG